MSVSRRTWTIALLFAASGLCGCGDGQSPAVPPAPIDEGIALPSAVAQATTDAPPAPPPSPREIFWQRLSALCGQAFAGYLTVGTEESDRAFGESDMTMHVRDCNEQEIRIPFAVGENRSRTWVVRATEAGLSLHHRHVDESGRSAAPDNYGGNTATEGSMRRQEFVVNEATKAQLPETRFNVWAMEVVPGKTFAYELQRPQEERYFRVEFDLDQPIETPPAPWGETG